MDVSAYYTSYTPDIPFFFFFFLRKLLKSYDPFHICANTGKIPRAYTIMHYKLKKTMCIIIFVLKPKKDEYLYTCAQANINTKYVMHGT